MRVMTYNVRGGWGSDGRKSTERIAEVVRGQFPDIVCFQEVHQRLPQSKFVDQPARLEQQLGMPFVFQANLHLGVGRYGVGVASRYPVRGVRNHLLPSVREQRGALQVTLETPDGLLTVFCTHWGLNGEERERQAAQLADLIADVSGLTIVCGDLNERPDAPAVRLLLDRTGLSDADAALSRPTYPTERPEARIDYVFFPPSLMLTDVSVLETPASDHLPLIADFSGSVTAGVGV